MIAPVNPAPLRRVRLNRCRGMNQYALKERFAALCEQHSVTLVTISRNSSPSWTEEKDRRRCVLIDKSLQADLTFAEQNELSDLQQQAEAHFDEVAPPPIDGALKIHAQLLKLASTSNK
jgi:hypothetical protein